MSKTRYSKQRELIYEALVASKEHPSAEMLYHALKAGFPSLSLGTVYRNLNLLVEEGRAVRIPSAINRFDGAIHEHPHFYCKTCEGLFDLTLAQDEDLITPVEAQGYRVQRHDLIFQGLCPVCRQAEGRDERKQSLMTQTQPTIKSILI